MEVITEREGETEKTDNKCEPDGRIEQQLIHADERLSISRELR